MCEKIKLFNPGGKGHFLCFSAETAPQGGACVPHPKMAYVFVSSIITHFFF